MDEYKAEEKAKENNYCSLVFVIIRLHVFFFNGFIQSIRHDYYEDKDIG